MGKTTSAATKLKSPKISKEINNLYLNNTPKTAIREYLIEKFGIEVNIKTLDSVIKDLMARRDYDISKDTEMKDEYKNSLRKLFSFVSQQTTDMQKMWDYFMSEGVENIKVKEMIAISREIRERMKLIQDRIDRFEEVSKGPKNGNINLYQYSQDNTKMIRDYLKLLESSGIIKKLLPYPFEDEGDSIDIDYTVVEDEHTG